MREVKRWLIKNPGWAYAVFWLWLIVVTALSLLGYRVVIAPVWSVLVSAMLGTALGSDQVEGLLFTQVLPMLAGILIWWRAVKVMVFHGAPLSFGMETAQGRLDEGKAGRRVACSYIGNPYSGSCETLFFAIMRAHPVSDKLMRYRLEQAAFAMPLGWAFRVAESRIFFQKLTANERANVYKNLTRNYFKMSESTSLNKFRGEVVKGMQALDRQYQRGRSVKRIDGLDWTFHLDGAGVVRDDFGREVRFNKLPIDEATNPSNEAYSVEGLGPRGDKQKTVYSITQLRRAVSEDLVPVD